jgi:uncharacterized protein (TIGR03437 family)
MSCKGVLHAAVLIAGLTLPAIAQFSHLSATDDGKNLFFTSHLVLKGRGSPSTAQGRLYRLGPDGPAMFAEAGTFGPQQGRTVNSIVAPAVTGDGKAVGFSVQGVCSGARLCGILMAGAAESRNLGSGTLHLSRNGKWALLAPDFNPLSPEATLIELATGQRFTVPPLAFSATSPLASDGSVMVLSDRNSMSVAYPAGVWKSGKFTPFAPYQSVMIQALALSDDAGTLIFKSGRGLGQLIARDLASGRDTVLYTFAGQMGPGMSKPEWPVILGLSNNGQRVLYRVGATDATEGLAYLSDVPTGKTQPMPLEEGELVSDGTLSGSGDLAFLVTMTGRLVKITLSTNAVDTLIPSTPSASNFDWWAFGSLFHMRGTFSGSPADWKNRILIGGQAAPVLSLKPGLLDIQIPWSEATGSVPFRIVDSGASPFEQNEVVLARPYALNLEKANSGEPSVFGIRASNGDGSGPPAAQPGPGDTFRLYMTGLGPVENQPPTGTAAPSPVPSPIRAQLTCSFMPHTNPIETVSASLAPGMIGVYQATFRLPANAAAATLIGASCQLCGPCDAVSEFPYHGRCGDACMVSGTSMPMPSRGFRRFRKSERFNIRDGRPAVVEWAYRPQPSITAARTLFGSVLPGIPYIGRDRQRARCTRPGAQVCRCGDSKATKGSARLNRTITSDKLWTFWRYARIWAGTSGRQR